MKDGDYRHFLVIVPQVIPADGSTKACIHLINLNEFVSLTCTLHTNKDDITLIKEVIRDTNWHRCISFQDSILYIAAADEVKLNVTGKGDTYQFEKIKKIHLDKRQKSSIFIQTDKPFYKPGQTAKFRIVSMNEHFMPDLAQIPLVTVRDPNRNRIAQWLNVTTQKGIGDLSIPLASEPIQGQYKIEVQGAKSIAEHSFTVEKYGEICFFLIPVYLTNA
ncbi:pregnancy zone protein-like [Protopterus annectens]|uniref:pregnancy zone protein-like n=1 Tax=Protopterus annectens TaxID=7888 RepID=UPI001CFB8201|nr:pregnancy zone protein-like [Protopterus annectens]